MTADRDNRLKGGHYGNARDGAVTPRRRHEARKPARGENDLGLEIELESGEITQAIHNLEYDPVNKVLKAYKAPVSGGGGGGGESVAYAVVVGGTDKFVSSPYAASKPFIEALARFPIPQDPPKASDWTKLDLPLNYTHGGLIPAAPNTNTHRWPKGVGLARLLRGSIDVGSSAWDADLDPVPPLANVAARPHDFITRRGTDPTKIYCYFDKASISNADYTKITLNLGYTVTAATTSGPVLTLTVSPALTAPDVAAGLNVTFLSKALVVCTDAETTDNVYLSAQTVAVSTVDNDSPIAVADVAIRGALIDPTALNKIKVFMSGPISAAASTAGWTITGGSPALSLTGAAVTDATNGILELTLDRSVTATDVAGVIELAHTAGITTQTAVQTASPFNIPSGPCASGGPTSVVFKAARSTYVLVINRYTEKEYKAGDIIQIAPASFLDIEDNIAPANVRRCYDSRIYEAAPEDTYVGRIIGGNTLDGGAGPGIKHATLPPSVATVIDPYADPTLADGVGYAYLYRNGIQQFTDLGAGLVPMRVIIRHYNSVIPYALMRDEVVLLSNTQVLIAGAGNNTAYTVQGF